MTRRRLAWMAGVTATVVLLAAVISSRRERPRWERHVAAVSSLPARLVERGVLESRDAVNVLALADGEILELAASGSRVTNGQVLLRMDAASLQEEIDELQLEVDTTLTDVEVNRAELNLTRLREQNRITMHRKRLDVAALRAEKAKVPLTKEDRRLLEIDLEIAELNLLDARDELARQTRLHAKGFVSDAMLEPFLRRVSSAEARLEELKSGLALREKGLPAEQIVEYEKEVLRLEAQIERGQQAMDRRVQAVSNRIESSHARIAKDAHTLAQKKQNLEQTETVATRDGIFSVRLYRDWRSGGGWREYKPGIEIHRTDAVGQIIDPGAMNVNFMIHEVDIGRARTGMPVRVTVPALDGRVFDGRLTAVSGLGRDRHDVAPEGHEERNTGVTVFGARAVMESEGAEFCPGMSAIVEVLTEEPRPELSIPRDAVVHLEAGPDAQSVLIFVERDGKPTKTTVRGRTVSARHFAVDDGLAEGDVVLIPRKGTPSP